MAHHLAPGVDVELDEIWYYIATHSGSIDSADRMLYSITDRFLLLSSHPHIGRRRDEDLRLGLRSFPMGEDVIIYRIKDEDVLILHVTHGRRKIDLLFGN